MRITGVYFEELGMAEAVWVIEADSLPLTVGIDAHGGDLFAAAQEKAKTKFQQRFNIKQDIIS
jgi:fumarate hydratase subunit beta